MAYNPHITGQEYYDNKGVEPREKNLGDYQYVSLKEIVDNFMLTRTGEGELINKVKPFKVLYYAKRAIQELNYDALKEVRVMQRDIGHDLRFPMPQDYVSWVRISLFKDGVLYKLGENIDINFAREYVQDNNFDLVFSDKGDPTYLEQSKINQARLNGELNNQYLNNGSNNELFMVDGRQFFTPVGASRFGLDGETANANPVFRINRRAGSIEFDSRMSGESCILEYVSDGMEYGYRNVGEGVSEAFRDDEQIKVNKFFEAYVYEFIAREILSSKHGVQEYIVRRVEKKASALLKNARIRLNINPGELLMKMRNQNNHLK